MKILHLIASTDIGGAEKHLLDLCLQQQASGLQISVALPAVGALSIALQTHDIPYRLIHAGGRWHPLALWSLRKLIRQVKPDLVHAHMLKSASMVGNADRSVPCVATAHNIVKHKGPFRFCRHIICVSDMVRDSLCRLGYPENKTTVVYNAVDTLAFDTDKRNELRCQSGWQDQLVVLCVARLVPAKGQQYAIEALAQLVPQLANLKLVLAGAGPDREKLMRLAHKLGVTEHLSLLDARNDVPDLLAASDIYLQPSVKEGFCIAFLEAMATGLACIGTNTGAIPNMLESGVNGLLIPAGQPMAIADAILSIATDTDRRASLGRAAKVTAQTKFSLEKQAGDTLKVYLHALGR
ncbi:MAG: glycosyltransferase family 4 protein [Sulfuriferula sp.]